MQARQLLLIFRNEPFTFIMEMLRNGEAPAALTPFLRALRHPCQPRQGKLVNMAVTVVLRPRLVTQVVA